MLGGRNKGVHSDLFASAPVLVPKAKMLRFNVFKSVKKEIWIHFG